MMPYPPFPSEISAGPIHIQIWGFFAALGFVLALKMALGRAYGAGIPKYLIWDLLILALVSMIAGGRLFHFLSMPDRDISALAGIHGGFSLAGGAAAAGIACLIYLRVKNLDSRKVFDCLIPGAIAALILARVGCFLVNDHVGKATLMPWGIPYEDGPMRHPVALYEISFLLAMFFAIRREERETKSNGALFILFSLLYASFRVLADFLRCDDLPVCEARFSGLTASQWFFLGSIFALVGLSLFSFSNYSVLAYNKKRRIT